MSRQKTSDSKAKLAVVDTTEEDIASVPFGRKNVTLVKPAQPEMAEITTSQFSSARPKIGRFQVITASLDTQDNAEEQDDAHVFDTAELQARPWDSKFAFILIALLVIVNLGLVLVLHTNKSEPSVTESVVVPPAPEASTEKANEVSPAPEVVNPAPAVVAPTPSAQAVTLPITVTPAAIAPAAAAPAPVAETPAATPQTKQELLTIINKN